ncbi:phosphoserine phosphatase SerB [Chromobacterium subtsugae]|mgnify:CR=1 FL=1|uniref:Phosphoserine phosphatase n=1 Tax=Chromobacterium subtsugae TaxID=251747 RepID=A0ABS7FM51_9NEIS|nr:MULTISPECIES: phosphoserine phosphatase SerB [Chromobacterium]KUM04348.1 phosphoserine phosphatase [Chromobacterium subtsugae]KZE86489.1 phosphoserine phosphatase [Chromobacterium sp. F49]MBW7569229.1 phosphoserine phosphatase SerB [Chromobacterium subtsugae]MBW8290349.1 phosphoserine phosphatase SerB [Chromobacterium subtsugae]OBU88331.1 phosphoserine phosphatase [Chromobacterium subtsugae]
MSAQKTLVVLAPQPDPQHLADIARLAGGQPTVGEGAARIRAVLPEHRRQAIEQCRRHGYDAAYVDSDKRLGDFGLLVSDMDSTLINIECIDEIADIKGLKPQVAEITERAMRGELDFGAALKERVALLAGLPESALEQVYRERLRLNPGAEALLAACRGLGIKTLLVSGGFTYFTDRLKADYGLDYAYANQLEIVDGRLTGRLTGDIIDAAAKQRLLMATRDALQLRADQVLAVGDGANDLPMLREAGVGIAYHAKPMVSAEADIAIERGGLDAILQLFL